MEYVLTKKEGSIVDAKVTIDGEIWSKAQKKSFNKLAANLQVPGFRKGKLPLDMARKYIDPRRVLQESIDLVLQKGYTHVLETEGSNLDVMAQPDVAIEEISEEKLVVVYSLTVRPEVKLGAYEGIEITKDEVKVTSEDVEAELKRIQEKNAELVSSEESVKNGDIVTLDFKGFVDGEAFEGGEAKDFELTIGSGQFIPGFEEALIGAAIDEKRDVEITFPEQYVPALAGQKATFKCHIHAIKTKRLPELDDNLALDENIDGVATLDELKAHLEKVIGERKEKQADSAAYEKLVNQIVDGSEVDIPVKVLDQDIEANLKSLKERVSQQGITYEQYLELTNSTEEKVKEEIAKNCKPNLKKSFVFGEIAKANNLTVTNEDLDAEFAKIADMYKMELESVKNALRPRINDLANDIFMRKLHELLISKNVIK